MIELKTNIVVVGVGLAGSQMVNKLQKENVNYIAFESNSEPGGIAKYITGVNSEVAKKLGVIRNQNTLEQLDNTLAEERDLRRIHTSTHVIEVKKGELYAISANGELIKTRYDQAIIASGSREATKWELKIIGDDVYGFYSVSMVLRLTKNKVIPAKKILVYGDTLKTRILIANLNNLITNKALDVTWVIPPNKDRKHKYEIDNIEILEGELVKAKGDKWVKEVHIESEGSIKHVKTDLVVLGKEQVPAVSFLKNGEKYMPNIYYCGEAKREFSSVEDIIQDCKSTIHALLD